MIWIIISITLYMLTCGIALFLICSSDKIKGSDAYFDIRNIGVAIFWPIVIVFASFVSVLTRKKPLDGPPMPIPDPKPRPK